MLYDVNSKQFKALLIPNGDAKLRHKPRANVAPWAQKQAMVKKQSDKNAHATKPTSA